MLFCKNKKLATLFLVFFWIYSMTMNMPIFLDLAQAQDFSPPADFSPPGNSWVPPDAGMPASPSDFGTMGPGGPAMGDMMGPGMPGPMGPGTVGPGTMGPGMMGPGMTGPGMPPSADSGWITDAGGNWTPPADWTPPVGWTPPSGWQPGQPISAQNAPWNQTGMMAPGGIPIMNMPADMTGFFGPGGPAMGDLTGQSGVIGTGAMPPAGMTGVFGGSAGFFAGGVMGMPAAQQGQQGPVIAITPPPEGSGWTMDVSGNWTPPSDWTPPLAWEAPEGWQPGQPITLEQAPWNTVAARRGETASSTGGFIPGTLIKVPEGKTLDETINNFDPTALGVSLPSFMTATDFQKIMKGEVAADNMTQEMLKALNPGKFGPMSDPYIMARTSGLNMDEMGNFFVQASEGAPGNPFIVQAKALADEGKYQEALAVLNDPTAPFNQFPDALIHTWKASIAASSGVNNDAVQNMEKALALAPFDDKLYQKVGEIYKQAGVTGPQVFVNGVKPEFDVKPFVESGRTLVPFRALAETMGADVGYDAASKTVTVTRDTKVINMVIGSNTATVNGNAVTLDVPAQIVDGRTVIPLRFVGESLDADVGYNSETQLIKILPKTAPAVN